MLQWEDRLYLEKHGGRLLELVLYSRTFANSILHVGKRNVSWPNYSNCFPCRIARCLGTAWCHMWLSGYEPGSLSQWKTPLFRHYWTSLLKLYCSKTATLGKCARFVYALSKPRTKPLPLSLVATSAISKYLSPLAWKNRWCSDMMANIFHLWHN